MNTQFHVPSFGDEVFDLDDTDNNTRTTSTTINFATFCNSSMSAGNVVANNNGTTASYMYQQQTTSQQQQQPTQTKRMINLHNTSDEYHTANEDSFTTNTNSVTVGGSSSLQASGQQGVLAAATTPTPTLAARKQMSPADPNEPTKPLSAYALFFRDTVSAIKQQNPTCSFPELSKIVASMWDALDPVHKSVYNKKNELARNEYLKQMDIYRQKLKEKKATQNSIEEQLPTVSNNTPITTGKSAAVFTMNINEQQVPTSTPLSANSQQTLGQNNNTTSALAPVNAASSAPAGGEQVQLSNESGSFQKCTRDGCPKRAIINPDWEDEYCSNDCVVIHCRNVFNDWVKSNLEAKQQQPQQHQSELQQAQATT